jgi:FkbM family methyltransferase
MDQDSIYAELGRAYFSEHPDEEDVLQHLPVMLKGVAHFADIGASLGQFTCHANQIIHNGRIDAFEAEPMRVAKLKENCEHWAATSGNTIKVHHAAVARSSGRIPFFSTQSNVSGGLFPNALTHLDDQTRTVVNWTEVEVPAISLDEFYADQPPQFIKMDIEGAEGEALLGAARLLCQRQTRWLIELHGFENGWQPDDVIDFMRFQRYHAEEIAPARRLFTPRSASLVFKQKLKSSARLARNLFGR